MRCQSTYATEPRLTHGPAVQAALIKQKPCAVLLQDKSTLHAAGDTEVSALACLLRCPKNAMKLNPPNTAPANSPRGRPRGLRRP